jgi:Kef-type K+ transport system membrane component KefB
VNPAELPALLLALAVIVAAARLLGWLAHRLGQPEVIGEIVAGILLGPSLAHGVVTAAMFPAGVRPALTALANVGICIFMFFVGLHLDRELLRGQGRTAATVSVGAMVLPFGLGVLLALYLGARHPTGNRLAFALFIGTALSITAFPVLARILNEKGLVKTPIGGLALACAALDDVLAWSLLAVVVAIAGASHHSWRVLLVAPFAAALLKVTGPMLARAGRHLRAGPLASGATVVAGAAGLVLCAEATDWMGLHPIFGAFLFGVVVPRDVLTKLSPRVLPRVAAVNSFALLPVYFLIVGLKVNLAQTDVSRLAELALILAAAVGGKGIGAYLGARVCGARPRHSAVLATLMNTRGLTELIALTVGLQLGLLDQALYSLMVVMAVVTTAMTGVLLRLIYPPDRVRQDIAARQAAVARPSAAAGRASSAAAAAENTAWPGSLPKEG